jgi:hypothetical protein
MDSISCKTLGSYRKTQKNLNLNIKAFSNEFESKTVGSSAEFLHPDHRSKYLAQSLGMTKRITIFITDIQTSNFLKDKVPAFLISRGPEEGFNRTIVTIRYQIAVLPSTKVKSLLVEQELVLNQKQWVIMSQILD